MANWREAILDAAAEADRLHTEMGLELQMEEVPGCIDIFAAIHRARIRFIFKKLDSLLGAYLRHPRPGIIVTTERPLSIQRFTAAHELGHAVLGHTLSLDKDGMLSRTPFRSDRYDIREASADAFASSFLVPKWLLEIHAGRQKWNAACMKDAPFVYQMALRLGVSYDATCRALERWRIITSADCARLIDIQPRSLKMAIVGAHEPIDWRRDVWVLTEADAGSRIQAGSGDLFLLDLRENSGAGYLWNAERLTAAGFAVIEDRTLLPLDEQQPGEPPHRRVLAQPLSENASLKGRLELVEQRPWLLNRDEATSRRWAVNYELIGKERGLPQTARAALAIV
jgi:Zn-dependent peptidase ImmA (M78 family)